MDFRIFIVNFFKGIVVGVGNIAPGVSGGALAMIMGIYESMVKAVGNFFKDIKKNFLFLMPIGAGAAIGVVGFSWILKYLFRVVPMQTSFAFAGLIIGTLPVLFKRANKKGFKKINILPLLVTLILGLSLTFLETGMSEISESTQIVLNTTTVLILIIAGFVMAGSIVIPGISGSVLLMLMGVYHVFLDAISTINLYLIVPAGLGLGLGVLAFSKLMDYLLDKHYGITYYAIIGFVIGAIPEIITDFSFDMTGFVSILCLIAAYILSYQISKLDVD